MPDPIEDDACKYDDVRMLEEAVEAFLDECLQSEEFCKFVDKGFVSLDEMKKSLFDSAEIEHGEIRFWARSADEFIETLIEDYADDQD